MEIQKELEARVAILEYRQDETTKEVRTLAETWVTEHRDMRKTLEGIQGNLQAIKWAAIGALGVAILSMMGAAEGFSFLKALLL